MTLKADIRSALELLRKLRKSAGLHGDVPNAMSKKSKKCKRYDSSSSEGYDDDVASTQGASKESSSSQPPSSEASEPVHLKGRKMTPKPTKRNKKGIYMCPVCTKSNIISDEAFNRHWLHHTHDSGLKCCKCKKILSSRRMFKQHLLTHQTDKKYKCPHCDGAYSTKDARTAHVSEFHPEGGQRRDLTCPHCNSSYSKHGDMVNHAKRCPLNPNALPPLVCLYEGCKKEYTLPGLLNRHMKNCIRRPKTTPSKTTPQKKRRH